MNMTRDAARRLAFSKYLLNLGKREVGRHEPLRSCSLLFFHDATELFLDTIAHHFSAVTKSCTFIDYWKLLGPYLPPSGLPQQRDFDKLNKARVALKHHGLHPAKSELEDFKIAVQKFFEDVVPLVFGRNFDSISLAEFISDESIRNGVKEAMAAFESGEYYNVTLATARAFDLLVSQVHSTKGIHPLHTPLAFNRLDSPPYIMRPSERPDEKARDFLEQTKKAIESLQDTVKILALGIDFRSYSRFHALTPEVVTFLGGTKKVFDRHRGKQPQVSAADADFCIEFVISTTIELQERNFNHPAYITK